MELAQPETTSEISKKIEAISKETIHHICSGQVVFDLAIAIKELIENSLDSSASTIEIRLTDYGMTSIVVNDNGCGVLERDFNSLALKHHTSKLKEFSDLTELDTFGFRGEALSSLSAISDLSVITKNVQNTHAFKLEFDQNGFLMSKEVCAREQGTTVTVKNIFKNLPVRAKEFKNNIKKEYATAVQLLYGYCLVSVNTKILCTNTISGKSPSQVVSTPGSNTILQNVGAIFGVKSLKEIIEIELESPNELTLLEYNLPKETNINFTWDFWVSDCQHSCGRLAPDRQFFYVNGRPCNLPKISKLVNRIYHQYNNKKYPFIFLNLKLDQQNTDINVTPDKRTIFLTQERCIWATIQSNLEKKWSQTQGYINSNTRIDLNINKKRPIAAISFQPSLKKLHVEEDESLKKLLKKKSISKRESTSDKSKETEDDDCSCDVEYIESCNQIPIKNQTISKVEYTQNTEEVLELPVYEVPINFSIIKKKMEMKRNALEKNIDQVKRIKYRVQLEENRNADAEDELKKELTKQSFAQMTIIGQFNLGFIIARLNDDLFIIDQHASDEKFRFEKLSNETKLKTQPLIVPTSLNLSTLNEMILMEHQRTFEDNGFTFNVNSETNPGERIKLTGVPVSGNWQLGQEDVEELIFLIKEGATGQSENSQILRPTRVRQMLASRACRGAIMVGKALKMTEMEKLTIQMSLMNNPWNCPHGRPTIRHLISLLLVNK